MSSSRAASSTGPRRSAQTKTEEVASVIESLLQNHGVTQLAPKTVHIGKEIGKGKFKKVNEGRLKQEIDDICVVTRFEKKDSEVREVSILALLAKHRDSPQFVPRMFGVVNERTSVALVQEHAQHGTLKNLLTCQEPASKMSAAHMQQAAMQIAGALAFLASLSIVHADLACRNVLVFCVEEDASKLLTKITDFGLAVVLQDGADSVCLKQPLAIRWCSPEAVAFSKLSHRTDVWSYGVTLWELFTECDQPWKAIEKRADVTAQLTELATPESMQPDMSIHFPIPDLCPRSTYDALLSCLRIDENARPSAAQLQQILTQVNEAPAFATDTADSIGVSIDGMATFASASTEASVADVSPKSSRSPVRRDGGYSRFEVLSDFLWSPRAKEMLERANLQAMQNEILEALGKECRSDSDFQPHLSETETKDKASRSNSGTTCLTNVQPQREPIREIFLSLVDGPVRSWKPVPPLSIWTLWSLLDDGTLRRRDFAYEDDARAALEADGFGALVEQKVFAKPPSSPPARNARWIPVQP